MAVPSLVQTLSRRLPARWQRFIPTALVALGLVLAVAPLPIPMRALGAALAAVILAGDIGDLAVSVKKKSAWHALSRLRFWCVLAVTAAWPWIRDGNPDFAVFGCAVVFAVAVAVPPLRVVAAPYAYNLPGLRDGKPAASKVPPISYPVVSVVAVIALIAAALADATTAVVLLIGLIATVAWSLAADAVVRRQLQTIRLVRALRAYRPEIGIAFAGRSGGPWQLRMWEPYLLRSGLKCVLYNVNEEYAEMIREGGGLKSPFVQLSPYLDWDLRTVLVPSLTSLYYVQNARTNAEFMAHTRITHVWLNHGDSDKPANFNARHALYDKLVVCGQAGIDRYANHDIDVEPARFEVLGRPQASDVQPASGPIADVKSPVVFYGPTWQGLDPEVNFSSLEHGPEIVRQLIGRDATVVFRPHPLSYRWRIRRAVIHEIHSILEADAAGSGRQHVWGDRAEKEWSIADCSNAADALISDVSSVVSDFLQSTKPYAMVSMRAGIEDFREEFSVAQTGYVILADLSNLGEVLDDMLGADPLAEARVERKRYVLGDFAGQESADAFASFVRRLAGK